MRGAEKNDFFQTQAVLKIELNSHIEKAQTFCFVVVGSFCIVGVFGRKDEERSRGGLSAWPF